MISTSINDIRNARYLLDRDAGNGLWIGFRMPLEFSVAISLSVSDYLATQCLDLDCSHSLCLFPGACAASESTRTEEHPTVEVEMASTVP